MYNYRKLLDEPMPCDGCVHSQRCASKKLACFAFAQYVYKGEDNWNLPRLPTRRTYERIMFTLDQSLQYEVNQQLKTLEVSP
jgi:hypothetical protein